MSESSRSELLRLFLGLSLVSGCGASNARSEDIRSEGMYAEFSVSRSPPSTEAAVAARFLVGGPASNTHVELGGADRLLATVADQAEVELDKQPCGIPSGCDARYAARLDVPATEVEIRIALLRGPEDTSAPENLVTLPAPILLSGPEPTATLSRERDGVELSWTAPDVDDGIELDVSGTCIARNARIISDVGTLVLEPGTLRDDPEAPGESCTVRVSLERNRDGTIDPGFDDGTFTATESDSLEFTSAP